MAHLTDSGILNSFSHPSGVSRNHVRNKLGCQQQNFDKNIKHPANELDGHANSINSQMKAVVCENAMLKKEVKVLQEKCKKIEHCEKQFNRLQTQYQEFVKSSSNRQNLERQLRLQLEDDLREAQRVMSRQMSMSPRPMASNSSQTDTIESTVCDNTCREEQLMREMSALRLMLREKEELILSLISERNSKSTAFCPEDYDEDYIASNIVSL
jgi:hypothetical protein